MKFAPLFLGLAATLALGCNNECDFFERCDGTTLQICGDGPDQVVNRKIHESPCVAPAGVCVQADEDSAYCAHDPETMCDDAFDESCDGTVRVHCREKPLEAEGTPRYVVAIDCASSGKGCIDDGTAARCE